MFDDIGNTVVMGKQIIKCIIEHNDRIGSGDFDNTLELIIKSPLFLKNVKILEKILSLNLQRHTDIRYYIIGGLFENFSIYSNKICDIYFKMFVDFGIFKIDSNNKIIDSTIEDYQIIINKMLPWRINNARIFNKKLVIQLIKFGANNFTVAFNCLEQIRLRYKSSEMDNSDKIDNFIKWLKEYVAKNVKE
jgi:hypothetical protein